MVGPISNRSSSPIKPVSPAQRRSPRLEVNLGAIVESDGVETPSQIKDVSTSGAAIFGSPPKLSNEMFVTLHVEGMNSMDAKVVREFEGGYAIQFDGPANAIPDEHLSSFRAATKGGI
jgi:hypothetical protein